MPSSYRKILYLITDLNIGGTEKMLYELVTRIDRAKFNPLVCGLKGWGYYAKKIKNTGIPVITLNVDRGIPFLKNFQVILSLAKIIRKEKIDLVHTFLFRANFLGRIAAKLAGVAVVISSIRVMEKEKKYHLFLERLTSFLSEQFLVNSQALKNFIAERIRIAPEKIEIIYNGIDLLNLPQVNNITKRKEFGFSENDILIGTVGRLHKQKGIEYFIKAIKIVTQSLNRSVAQSLKFLIVGNGPGGKSLRLKVKSSKLENKVLLTGWRSDALEIISILDIFVLPSLWEGTPNVILEALAYVKPVITTNVGGAKEIIEDGINGLLVEPANAQALANAILWVLGNQEKAKKMAEKGKEKVEKFFSINKMVEETERLYERLWEKQLRRK